MITLGFEDPLGHLDHEAPTLDIDASSDFGLLRVQLGFPKFVAPSWTEEDWKAFLGQHWPEIHGSLSEFLVQSTSLSYAERHRNEVIGAANTVIIDFRGDLWNAVLPMSVGGYKIGVYRRDTTWPTWLTIRPTYELAVEEARRIADAADLPPTKILRIGKLNNPALDSLDVLDIRSATETAAYRMTFVGGAIVGGIVAGLIATALWLMLR